MIYRLGIIIGCLLLAQQSAATEIALQWMPLGWKYQESMNSTPGFTTSTPLKSSATGAGWLLDGQLRLHASERIDFAVGASWLTSLNKTDESWQTPTTLQHNRLSISQSEWMIQARWRADELSPLLHIGLNVSGQQDQQQRSQFYINGALSTFVGTATETIQSHWLSLSLDGTTPRHDLRVHLEGGVPWSDRMSNTVLPGQSFHSQQQAWRVRVHMDYPVYHMNNGSSTRLKLTYRYRQLGSDVRTLSLWPSNHWQVLGLGLQQTW